MASKIQIVYRRYIRRKKNKLALTSGVVSIQRRPSTDPSAAPSIRMQLKLG
jgi:hypothetical protein